MLVLVLLFVHLVSIRMVIIDTLQFLIMFKYYRLQSNQLGHVCSSVKHFLNISILCDLSYKGQCMFLNNYIEPWKYLV